MNKILSTLALAGLAGASIATAATDSAIDGLSVKAKVGYENEYIFRGKEHSADNIQTRVVGEYALPIQGANAGIYAGGFLMSPLTETANAAEVFVGAKTEIEKTLIDVGYTYYGFPNNSTVNAGAPGGSINTINNRAVYNGSNEIKVGAAFGQFKDILTPSLYFYYDFNLQQLTTEVAVRRTFRGDDYGINGVELILAGYFGYVSANQYNGSQLSPGIAQWSNAYGYVGGSADIAYNVTSAAKVGLGIRYAYNNDGDASDDIRLSGNTESNFYYGVWAEFRY